MSSNWSKETFHEAGPSLGIKFIGNKSTSREVDSAGWLFHVKESPTSNLTVLPILAILLFVICVILRFYKWSRDEARYKARGDVEFCEDSEVNYGIIQAGEKEYCNIDMRGDGISNYDTVNSFRALGNGFPLSINDPQYYHDTVTSIKSLVLQRADGSQYDSVKSYKAFLEKITQDKDLAVEVKLLENYPIRSKSVEHCVVLEEESSEKSEDVSSRLLVSLPLKKHIHQDGRFHQFDKKKQRHRRASGDVPPGMRKRSASNPTYRRSASSAASLPSVRYLPSSDSDEGAEQVDRRKLWAERKKISRSVSSGKIAKDPSVAVCPSGSENICGNNGIVKRKRHYSADSARRQKKAAAATSKCITSITVNKPVDLKDKSKAITKPRKHELEYLDDSSSENPASSHSSSDSNVPSDGVVSDTDDETKQNTLLSNASDDRTVDNDVFFSLDSGAELASSYEILQSSPHRPISDIKRTIARAKEDFFKKVPSNGLTTSVQLSGQTANPQMISSAPALDQLDSLNGNVYTGRVETSSYNHSLSPTEKDKVKLRPAQLSEAPSTSSKSSLSTGDQHLSDRGNNESANNMDSTDCITNGDGQESPSLSSPRKVQRFQVTFVNADLSNVQSE